MTRHTVLLDMGEQGVGADYRRVYTARCRACPWEGTNRAPLGDSAAEGEAHEARPG